MANKQQFIISIGIILVAVLVASLIETFDNLDNYWRWFGGPKTLLDPNSHNNSTSNPSTPSSTCNYSACNGQIQSYINKGWAYTSSDFGQCTGCPVVTYPSTLPTPTPTPTPTPSPTQTQSPTPTPSSSTCNYTACNGQIQSYINKGWAYTSSDFGQCTGCPVVSYPSTLPPAPAPAPAPTPTCNYSACNGQIQSYINKGWAYTSSNFGECAGCPVVSYPSTLPASSS